MADKSPAMYSAQFWKSLPSTCHYFFLCLLLSFSSDTSRTCKSTSCACLCRSRTIKKIEDSTHCMSIQHPMPTLDVMHCWFLQPGEKHSTFLVSTSHLQWQLIEYISILYTIQKGKHFLPF